MTPRLRIIVTHGADGKAVNALPALLNSSRSDFAINGIARDVVGAGGVS